jgi:dihydropteroate synthase
MRDAGLDPGEVVRVAPQARGRVVRLDALAPRFVDLLEREMLAVGGEAAVGRASAILFGAPEHFEALAARLAEGPAGARTLGRELAAGLAAWERRSFSLRLGGRVLELGGRTAVMGIVNVTPDSFSDGGAHFAAGAAVEHGLRLAAEGADILDVGGESTRPGAEPVPAAEELRRVLPVVEALAARAGVPVSVDTTKAEVAEAALAAGAVMVNDVSALRFDPRLGAVAAAAGAALVVMHMRGEPRTMQEAPAYGNLLAEVVAGLREGVARALAAGVDPERILVDPGIGFGKTAEHNLELLARLGELAVLGRPLVVGPSRKAFIGRVLGGAPPGERLEGTIAAACLAAERGAHLLRVHDVAAVRRGLAMADAIRGGGQA